MLYMEIFDLVFYFWKEGKILSHDPETQQVEIEVLSSLPGVSLEAGVVISLHPTVPSEQSYT